MTNFFISKPTFSSLGKVGLFMLSISRLTICQKKLRHRFDDSEIGQKSVTGNQDEIVEL